LKNKIKKGKENDNSHNLYSVGLFALYCSNFFCAVMALRHNKFCEQLFQYYSLLAWSCWLTAFISGFLFSAF